MESSTDFRLSRVSGTAPPTLRRTGIPGGARSRVRALDEEGRLRDLYNKVYAESKEEDAKREEGIRGVKSAQGQLASLVRTQLEGRIVREEDEEEAGGEPGDPTSTEVSIHLDVDEDDRLVVVGVSVAHIDSQLNLTEGFTEGQPIVIEISVTRDTAIEEVDIPDFPSLLTQDTQEARDIRATYSYRPGQARRIEFDTFVVELGYEAYWWILLESWLSLHDSSYLESMYGLARVPPVPRTPITLHSDEDVLRAALDKRGRVGVLSPDAGSISGIKGVAVAESWMQEDRRRPPFSLSYPRYLPSAQGLNDDAFITSYLEHKRRGSIFIADVAYASKWEATEALYRLRRQVGFAGISRVAQPGAVSGVLAEGLPRHGTYARPRSPASYVGGTEGGGPDPVERLWREVCAKEELDERDVASLRQVARYLDLDVGEGATPGELCRVIKAQYEREFGERSRLREAERDVPTVERSTRGE